MKSDGFRDQVVIVTGAEVLMGPGALALWTRLLSTGLLDWLSIQVFLEPAIRRAQKANRGNPA